MPKFALNTINLFQISVILTGIVFLTPLATKAQDEVTLFGRSVSVPVVKKKAEDGDATAMLLLSVMYVKGIGMASDTTEGLKWLQKSAKAGNPMAMNDLAMFSKHNM